ncbi:Molecular chaperone Hsp31 and glyoxalase 3 [Planctomycetes bacterium Poly30]|uniref:Molecular chaperone Hsp31 and glyoxalase 3 n=2 Tax=Saltatorellus ferox TaxID=2528018 RepID=A0A518EUZ1_9BACT|nr:Molecular chaperone Hsp31 and glyoxalase 3 [Planctomycetes bacterium Poly30]
MLIVLTSHEQLGDTSETTGFHLAELTHVVETFVSRGIPFVLASPKGGKPPIDAKDTSDKVNAWFLGDDDLMKRLSNTTKLSDVDPESFDGVYFPGGHGTMWDFPNNPEIQRIVSSIRERDGLVASICHGPAAFVGVENADGEPLVKGKRMTCFSDSEEREAEKADVVPFMLQSKLQELGATVEPTDNFQSKVVADDWLLTGQNPASAAPLGEAIAQALVQMIPVIR